MNSLILLFSLCLTVYSVPINLKKRYLVSTPKGNSESLKKSTLETKTHLQAGKVHFKKDFYLISKQRDCNLLGNISKVGTKKTKNEIFTIMYLNYLNQIDCDISAIDLSVYLKESNAIIQEVAVQLIGDKKLIKYNNVLDSILENTSSIYIKESIKRAQTKADITLNNLIPYLPMIDSVNQILEPFRNIKIENKWSGLHVIDYNDIVEVPIATDFIAPHQSYGREVKNSPGEAVYGNKHRNVYHAGIDSGWMLEGLPIHSISNGIVRRIQHESSWGTMIVVESQLQSGESITTLYAHLSRMVDVLPGDILYPGKKIGRIGNNVSYENGGYWAHTHIGIEKSNYFDAKLTGYNPSLENYYSVYDFLD